MCRLGHLLVAAFFFFFFCGRSSIKADVHLSLSVSLRVTLSGNWLNTNSQPTNTPLNDSFRLLIFFSLLQTWTRVTCFGYLVDRCASWAIYFNFFKILIIQIVDI